MLGRTGLLLSCAVLLAGTPGGACGQDAAEQEASRAMIEALDLTLLRCPLPSGLEDPGSPFAWGWVEGSELVGGVDSASGMKVVYTRAPTDSELMVDPGKTRALLSRKRERLGAVVWNPGKDGQRTCAWQAEPGAPRTVLVSGRIEGPIDREDGERNWINGCDSGGSQPVDDDGHFSFRVPVQGRCTLEVATSGFEEFGATIEPWVDLQGIVVTVPPDRIDGDSLMVWKMKQGADAARERIRSLQAKTDAWSRALASEQLSPGAQEVLLRWRAIELAEAWDDLRQKERDVVFFEAAEARTNAPSP